MAEGVGGDEVMMRDKACDVAVIDERGWGVSMPTVLKFIYKNFATWPHHP